MKPLKIAKSTLTGPPRYYAFRNYRMRGEGTLVVTGQKEDITEQIQNLLAESHPVNQEMLEALKEFLALRANRSYVSPDSPRGIAERKAEAAISNAQALLEKNNG